jgi:hypothetical protein
VGRTIVEVLAVAIDTGPRMGRVDGIGVRESGGGDPSTRTEVIGLEATGGNAASTKSEGQALGYSVMAERRYLAKEVP